MLVVEELGSLHLGDFKIIYCGGGPIKSAIRIIRPWFRTKGTGLSRPYNYSRGGPGAICCRCILRNTFQLLYSMWIISLHREVFFRHCYTFDSKLVLLY